VPGKEVVSRSGQIVTKLTTISQPEILKAAEDWKVDLIVMGSHGKSALGAALLGSVTIGLIHSETKFQSL
jgi:nucleotide-binding universal stress UspA family protein